MNEFTKATSVLEISPHVKHTSPFSDFSLMRKRKGSSTWPSAAGKGRSFSSKRGLTVHRGRRRMAGRALRFLFPQAGELRGTLTAAATISSPARSTLASIGHIQSGCCSSARPVTKEKKWNSYSTRSARRQRAMAWRKMQAVVV
jgi:hypothetical protein